MLALVGFGLQAQRAFGVVDLGLPVLGKAAHGRGHLRVNLLQVAGQILGPVLHAQDVAQEAVRRGDPVERAVHEHHGDTRLVLQLLRIGDVRRRERDARYAEDDLHIARNKLLAVDLPVAGKAAQVGKARHVIGHHLQLLLGEGDARARLHFRLQGEDEDLPQRAGEIHPLDGAGRGNGDLAAGMVGDGARAAEDFVACLRTTARERREQRHAAEGGELTAAHVLGMGNHCCPSRLWPRLAS